VGEQKYIAKTLTSSSAKKSRKTSGKKEEDVLKSISKGLKEVKDAKRSGKSLKTLDKFLDEL